MRLWLHTLTAGYTTHRGLLRHRGCVYADHMRLLLQIMIWPVLILPLSYVFTTPLR